MQHSEAANETCSDNRHALKIAFLNLYDRKVLLKIFEKIPVNEFIFSESCRPRLGILLKMDSFTGIF